MRSRVATRVVKSKLNVHERTRNDKWVLRLKNIAEFSADIMTAIESAAKKIIWDCQVKGRPNLPTIARYTALIKAITHFSHPQITKQRYKSNRFINHTIMKFLAAKSQ
jgi:hypothetical protein